MFKTSSAGRGNPVSSARSGRQTPDDDACSIKSTDSSKFCKWIVSKINLQQCEKSREPDLVALGTTVTWTTSRDRAVSSMTKPAQWEPVLLTVHSLRLQPRRSCRLLPSRAGDRKRLKQLAINSEISLLIRSFREILEIKMKNKSQRECQKALRKTW